MSIMFLASSVLHSKSACFFFLPILFLSSKTKSTSVDQESILAICSMAITAEEVASFFFLDTNT